MVAHMQLDFVQKKLCHFLEKPQKHSIDFLLLFCTKEQKTHNFLFATHMHIHTSCFEKS